MTTPAIQKKHIRTCECEVELRAYWSGLNVSQPSMARDPSVIAAKDARKAQLKKERDDAVKRISRAS